MKPESLLGCPAGSSPAMCARRVMIRVHLHTPGAPRHRRPSATGILVALALCAVGTSSCGGSPIEASTKSAPNTAPAPFDSSAPLHAVRLRGPDGPPSVVIGTDPRTGEEIRANCTTCHATRTPRPEVSSGAELEDFHTGLVTNHGGLTCLTCHDAQRYDRLRLADGRGLEHSESMRLCGQCHGPQLRDWTHGSHGGMSGHWDLTRGERVRNHCVVCHDPHAPQIRPVLPLPPPNDRFLGENHSGDHATGATEHHESDDHE